MRSGKIKPEHAVSRRQFAGCCAQQLLWSFTLFLIPLLLTAGPGHAEHNCAECIALGELSCRAGCDSPNSRAVMLKCARDCAKERCKDVCASESPDNEKAADANQNTSKSASEKGMTQGSDESERDSESEKVKAAADPTE